MKFNVFIAIVIMLLINGCDSSSMENADDVSMDTPQEIIDNVSMDAPQEIVEDVSEPVGYMPEEVLTVEEKVSNWYMKTIVDTTLLDGANYRYQKGGVFGELDKSSDGKDQYDVLSYGTGVVQVVFPQTEWEEMSGDYVSDYHAIQKEGEKRVWTFQIKNQSSEIDLSNAPIKISLEGPYDVDFANVNGYVRFKEKLSEDVSKKTSIMLVDVDMQTAYSYAQLQTANLNMGGLKTRTFRWVLGTVDLSDYEAVISPESKTVNDSALSRINKIGALADPNDKFGLPPSF